MSRYEPIQAAGFTEGRRKSATELARVVGEHHGWFLTEHAHELVDADYRLIAYTLEDAAVAMGELGWLAPEGWVSWSAIPHETSAPAAAEALRSLLDGHGKFPGR
jgi:hypothetical protein